MGDSLLQFYQMLLISNRFKCIDLDGNGVLTRNELQFFYEEQFHRMECMAQEPVLFEDILCQIIDMIGPEVHFLLSSNSPYFCCRLYSKWHATIIDL